MTGINEFYPFADAAGANVIDQATWAAGNLSQGQTRDIGFLGGLFAESQEANKAWRQTLLIAAMIGQYIAQQANQDARDTDTVAGLMAKFILATQNTAGRYRVPLGTVYNLYVAAGGNDANNGSSGAPFATIQRAWNQLYYNTDLNGNNGIINVGPGTYPPFNAFGPVIGAATWNSVQIVGDTATPTNVLIAASNGSAVTATNAQFFIEGVTIEASGTTTNAAGLIGLFPGTILTFDRINFGACADSHIQSDNGAFVGNIGVGSTYTISGGATAHMAALFSGVIQNDGSSVSIAGSPGFGRGFATADDLGVVRSFGCTWSGAATGPRYVAYGNGVIETQGAGAAYFPGNAAGTVSNGGIYNG